MHRLEKQTFEYQSRQHAKQQEWRRKTFPAFYKVKDFINETEIKIIDAELKAYDLFDRGMSVIFGNGWDDAIRGVKRAKSASDAAWAFEDEITRGRKCGAYTYYASCYASNDHVVCELKITFLAGYNYAEASEEIVSHIMQNYSGALGGYDVEFKFK